MGLSCSKDEAEKSVSAPPRGPPSESSGGSNRRSQAPDFSLESTPLPQVKFFAVAVPEVPQLADRATNDSESHPPIAPASATSDSRPSYPEDVNNQSRTGNRGQLTPPGSSQLSISHAAVFQDAFGSIESPSTLVPTPQQDGGHCTYRGSYGMQSLNSALLVGSHVKDDEGESSEWSAHYGGHEGSGRSLQMPNFTNPVRID